MTLKAVHVFMALAHNRSTCKLIFQKSPSRVFSVKVIIIWWFQPTFQFKISMYSKRL